MEDFLEEARSARREPLRRSKQQEKIGATTSIGGGSVLLVGELTFKVFAGFALLGFVMGAIALGFGSVYMANRPLEMQGPVTFTPSNNNGPIQLAQRAQLFTCAPATDYNVSICSSYCGAQNTTLNCNTTANSQCIPSVTPNGCYIVLPCDLGPWVGNEIILTSTLAGTDNILEVAPTYPDCPTRIYRTSTAYRSVVLTGENTVVSFLITGPNALTVTVIPVGTTTFVV